MANFWYTELKNGSNLVYQISKPFPAYWSWDAILSAAWRPTCSELTAANDVLIILKQHALQSFSYTIRSHSKGLTSSHTNLDCRVSKVTGWKEYCTGMDTIMNHHHYHHHHHQSLPSSCQQCRLTDSASLQYTTCTWAKNVPFKHLDRI